MTVEKLRTLNPDLKIYETSDKEFSEYGVVLGGFDTAALILEAEKKGMPADGSVYEASVESFEKLDVFGEMKEVLYGELPMQLGYCYGHSSFLNAWEWHADSEINVAVTDLVLLLARRSELCDGKIDSSKAKAFYIKKGEAIEVFATTLHFCPCEVEKSGFGCVVALPKGTNTPLDRPNKNPVIFRKNKWIIAHNENDALISKGVVAGISGENIEIKI